MNIERSYKEIAKSERDREACSALIDVVLSRGMCVCVCVCNGEKERK